jgi:hypothetical protein
MPVFARVHPQISENNPHFWKIHTQISQSLTHFPNTRHTLAKVRRRLAKTIRMFVNAPPVLAKTRALLGKAGRIFPRLRFRPGKLSPVLPIARVVLASPREIQPTILFFQASSK